MAQVIKIGKRYYSDFEWGGKRIRRSLSSDKKEAEKKLLELLAMRQADKHGYTNHDISFEFFEKRYMDYSKSEKVRNSHITDVRAFKYLQASLPITRLNQITPEYLGRLKTRWQEEKKTLSVVTRCVKAIKAAMRKAEDWNYIKTQNWRTVRVQEPKARLLFYTIEELRRLLEICHGPWKTAALLMARCGLRSGEAYWLEWKDVDYVHNRLHIHEKEGWKPKGGKERWVPISFDVKTHLEAIQGPYQFVLGANRMTRSSYHVYFKRIIKNARLKGSPHTLRHTFASHLVQNGVPLKTVSVLLGHSSIKMTEIYSHLSPETLEMGIERLPEL